MPKLSGKPKHEKLPWPGLKNKNYLTRIITQAVKEAKETRENEVWARKQLARIRRYIPRSVFIRLVRKELQKKRAQ